MGPRALPGDSRKERGMRKVLLLLGVVLVLAACVDPLYAQPPPASGCCYNGQKNLFYPAGSVLNFGALDEHGCVKEWADVWTPDPCPEATVAPPVPTAVPPPVPYEPPNVVKVPALLKTILGWFAPKFVVPFAALLTAMLIPVVQLLRRVLAAFGTKLSRKGIYLAAAFVALLECVATVASDGVIQGDEWVVVLSAALALLGGLFGYRFLFSDASKLKVKP
jgi:hypothetical protein